MTESSWYCSQCSRIIFTHTGGLCLPFLSFSSPQFETSDSEESESESEFEIDSDEDDDSEDDDDDSDDFTSESDDSDEYTSESEGSDSDDAADWDELERRAIEEDRRAAVCV